MLKDIDNIVLVALLLWSGKIDSQAKLSTDLGVSPAGLSRSLNRLAVAQLINRNNLSVVKPHAEEFILHGLRYVFPGKLGTLVRGVATAHCTLPLSEEFSPQEMYVWAAEFGKESGLEVSALHPRVPALCTVYPEFHPIFALIDVLRVGRARERSAAKPHLKKWIRNV